MDEIDARIVELLRNDARSSYADLATAVGLSPDSVRQRMAKLVERDELRILGVLEPEALGYSVLANVTVSYRGDLSQFVGAMRAHECVTFIASTVGRTNLLCEVAAEDEAQLVEFVAREIAPLPGVAGFEVLRLVDVLKWKGAGSNTSGRLASPIDFSQLDDIDTQILRVLVYDPRIKLTRLAERIGCPYPTTRRRVTALFAGGVIEAVAVTERVLPGKGTVGLVLLDAVRRESWAAGLLDIPGVNIASRTLGAHAGLLEVTADSAQAMVDRVEQIAAVPGVDVAETLMIARSLVLPVSWRFTTREV